MGTKTASLSWPSTSTIYTDRWVQQGGWPTKVDKSISSTVTATRTRTGVNLPNWYNIIRNGGNATTSLTATYDTVFCTLGYAVGSYRYYSSPTNWWERDCHAMGPFAITNNWILRRAKAPSKDITTADNGAKVKFYKKIRETEVAFSGGVFLGELRETLHMLRRPASALWKGIGSYRDALKKSTKGSGNKTRTLNKVAGGLWLEYSFGWIPFFNDIKDAVGAYDRLFAKQDDEVKHLNASFSQEWDRRAELNAYDDPNVPRNLIAGTTEFWWRPDGVKFTEKAIVRYKGAVRSQVERPGWRELSLLGFHPREFIPTAWELLPWSFLVDYFSNVGDILTANATNTRNLLWVNRTVRRFTRYEGTLRLDVPYTIAQNTGSGMSTLKCYEGSPSEWICTRKTIDRSANTALTLPTLRIGWDLSDGQLGNVAALLSQVLSIHPQNRRKV